MVVLVTGATSGIGYETAKSLAKSDAAVIVVGRDEAKTKACTERIRNQAGHSHIDYLIADLSSQQQVRKLVELVLKRYPKLNALVNNAGIFTLQRSLSVNGIEMQWAVNHLAYYTISESLAEVLAANAPSRIVQVASDSHRGATVDFDDLLGSRRYSGIRAYGQSKLANVLHTYDLARRLSGTGVTVNCLHPGTINTNIARNNGAIVSLAMRVRGFFTPGPAQGARTSVYLTTSSDVEAATGQYFVRCKPTASAPASYDIALQERLREVSAQMTGVRPARA